MQTALHIKTLVEELRNEIVGAVVQSTKLYRKERSAFIDFKTASSTLVLACLFHPTRHGCYCIPESKLDFESTEKFWPFFDVIGMTVVAIEQPTLDRIFSITLRGQEQLSIVVEALGPNANLWLLDSELRKLGVLRKREFEPRATYRFPSISDRLDPLAHDSKQLLQKARESDDSLSWFLSKALVGFNRTLAHEVLRRANFEDGPANKLNEAGVLSLSEGIDHVSKQFNIPGGGFLYQMPRNYEAYPFKLTSVSGQPERFKSLSLAIHESVHRQQHEQIAADEEQKTLSAVERALKKLNGRVEKLKVDIETASQFEQYKKFGDLLQIHHGKLKRGMAVIRVEDIVANQGEIISIPLDSSLTPRENIEEYFRKHRKGREGLEILKRRLEITKGEIHEMESMLGKLQENFEAASQRYAAQITALLPRHTDRRAEAARLPYRELTLTTGLRIFVGRDGSDNDRTTFEFSRPYELWFHAQQCPGSHVVMKYPNKSFVPSKREIEETAAIAAWHSKAKNNRLVPVIYTERKYVRKPRKAKPGLVTVEREKSIMVEPRKVE